MRTTKFGTFPIFNIGFIPPSHHDLHPYIDHPYKDDEYFNFPDPGPKCDFCDSATSSYAIYGYTITPGAQGGSLNAQDEFAACADCKVKSFTRPKEMSEEEAGKTTVKYIREGSILVQA